MDHQWSPQMRNGKFTRVMLILMLLLTSSGIITVLSSPNLSVQTRSYSLAPGDPVDPLDPLAYPPNPTSDISWVGGTSGVSDIQAAFNNARATENAQLGLAIPSMSLPSQATWNAMSNSDKALWLINRERQDRGVHKLHGVETNVISVAQYYATYLRVNDRFGHVDEWGNDPWDRLDANPAIGACHDFLNVAENLAAFWTSGSSIALPVERSIYMWMYEDGPSWGHRIAILWYPYNDNGGTAGMEGFLGIGRASGPHQGWNFAEIIVMNVFDPCSSWTYIVVTYPPRAYLPIVRK